MAARLILNADDFGLTRGINRAVADLHQAGVLTSATLMATGPAFDDAVAVSKAHPALGVGCHIVLVDGVPVSRPGTIPTLLGPDSLRFRSTLGDLVRDLLLGRIDEDEIAREASAQVHKLQCAGIDVTHVDTHKHTHIFPQVARPLVKTVQRTSVAYFRNPFEPAFGRRVSHANLKRRLQMFSSGRFRPAFDRIVRKPFTTDGTLGIAATGSLTAHTLHQLLSSLPDGSVYELCCHPGYHDADLDLAPTRLRATREIERQALLTTIPKILSLQQPPELIHYGNLKERPPR